MALAYVDEWLLKQRCDCVHKEGKVFHFADPNELLNLSQEPEFEANGIFNTEDLNIHDDTILANITKLLRQWGLYVICRLSDEADVVIYENYEYNNNYEHSNNPVEVAVRSFEKKRKKIFRSIEDAIELRTYTVISDNLF